MLYKLLRATQFWIFLLLNEKKRMINVQVLLPGINVFLPHLSNQISPVFLHLHYQIEKKRKLYLTSYSSS